MGRHSGGMNEGLRELYKGLQEGSTELYQGLRDVVNVDRNNRTVTVGGRDGIYIDDNTLEMGGYDGLRIHTNGGINMGSVGISGRQTNFIVEIFLCSVGLWILYSLFSCFWDSCYGYNDDYYLGN